MGLRRSAEEVLLRCGALRSDATPVENLLPLYPGTPFCCCPVPLSRGAGFTETGQQTHVLQTLAEPTGPHLFSSGAGAE
jgi:hypothetical protein